MMINLHGSALFARRRFAARSLRLTCEGKGVAFDLCRITG